MRKREKTMEYTPESNGGQMGTRKKTLHGRRPLTVTTFQHYVVSCNFQSVKTAWDSSKSGKYAALLNSVQIGTYDSNTS